MLNQLKFSFQNLENLLKSQVLSVQDPPDGRAQRLGGVCRDEKFCRFPLGPQLKIIQKHVFGWAFYFSNLNDEQRSLYCFP